jgi:hypothetical protein
VANTNAGVALALTVAVLTGMAKAHHAPVRRHVVALPRSSPERIEFGDTKTSVPVRPARGRVADDANVLSRTRARTATWYESGPSPGEAGPAVIMGYVDTGSGSAAFHRIAKMGAGDRVKVVRKDGRVAWFKVDSVRRVSRPSIPQGRTMSRAERPELRLITWRGRPGQTRHDDPGNTVVSAHLVHASPSDR